MKTFNQHNQYNILIEDITSKVRKLRKLSPADKKKVIDFFKRNNQLEKEIDWDNKNLTITDFQVVFHTPTKSKTNKAVKKKGIPVFVKELTILMLPICLKIIMLIFQ
jgi:hypothetical protein